MNIIITINDGDYSWYQAKPGGLDSEGEARHTRQTRARGETIIHNAGI